MTAGVQAVPTRASSATMAADLPNFLVLINTLIFLISSQPV
jgi:hypothetical protein